MGKYPDINNRYIFKGEPVNIGWFLFNADWLSAEEYELIANLEEGQEVKLMLPGGETRTMKRVSENHQVEPDQFHRTPMPIDLRASIRNTCEAFDKSDRAFILDEEEISLTFFFEQNCDTLPAAQFYDIFSLPKHEKIDFGGSAQTLPLTLKRIH